MPIGQPGERGHDLDVLRSDGAPTGPGQAPGQTADAPAGGAEFARMMTQFGDHFRREGALERSPDAIAAAKQAATRYRGVRGFAPFDGPTMEDGNAVVKAALKHQLPDYLRASGYTDGDRKTAAAAAYRSGRYNQYVPSSANLISYGLGSVLAELLGNPELAPIITEAGIHLAQFVNGATQLRTTPIADDQRRRAGFTVSLGEAGIHERVWPGRYHKRVREQVKILDASVEAALAELERAMGVEGLRDFAAMSEGDLDDFIRAIPADAAVGPALAAVTAERRRLASMQDTLGMGEAAKGRHATDGWLALARGTQSVVVALAGLLAKVHPWAGVAAQLGVNVVWIPLQAEAGASMERSRQLHSAAEALVFGDGEVGGGDRAGTLDRIRMGGAYAGADIDAGTMPGILVGPAHSVVIEAKRRLEGLLKGDLGGDERDSVQRQLRAIEASAFDEVSRDDVLGKLVAAEQNGLVSRLRDRNSMLGGAVAEKATWAGYAAQLSQKFALLYLEVVFGRAASVLLTRQFAASQGGAAKEGFDRLGPVLVAATFLSVIGAFMYRISVAAKFTERANAKSRSAEALAASGGATEGSEDAPHSTIERLTGSQTYRTMNSVYHVTVDRFYGPREAQKAANAAFRASRSVGRLAHAYAERGQAPGVPLVEQAEV